MGRSLLAICILMYGVLAASCVRDVEINLGDLPDRIVLNASVSPGKDVRAHVSKTWFIMDNVANFDLPDPKIRVYINGEFQGMMTLRRRFLIRGNMFCPVAGCVRETVYAWRRRRTGMNQSRGKL